MIGLGMTDEGEISRGLEEYYDDKSEGHDTLPTVGPRVDLHTVRVDDVTRLHTTVDIERFADSHSLSAAETELLSLWAKTGVQSNTSAWFDVTRAFFAEFDTGSQTRHVATILFMDAMNRADEIFDTNRDAFDDENVTAEAVESLSILEADGVQYTVKDFKRLLVSMLEGSGEFTDPEIDHIRWQIEHFINISTDYQREFEGKTEYSYDEALALRYGTVGPLVDTFASIFAFSKDVTKGGHAEQVAHQAISKFRKVVLAWQLSDDLFDHDADIDNGNMNLVEGILQDEHESERGLQLSDNDPGIYPEDFKYRFPRTSRRLKAEYINLTQDLPSQIKWVLDSRVPSILTTDYEEDLEQAA